MKNIDGYKNCPFCGKLIAENAHVCKHCGHEIPREYEVKKRDNFAYMQKHDPVTLMIGQILTIIAGAILLYSFLGDVGYQLSHLSPKVSEIKAEAINPHQECIQENINPPEQMTIGKGKTYRIILKQAKYTISGIVVAKNRNFWLRGFMQNYFDEVVPIDFGIVWGDIADIPMLKKHFKFKSEKTLGEARQLSWRCDGKISQSYEYTRSHISHNHIIPATDNVASAHLKVKRWDTIKLDGYLVDIVQPNGYTSMTSLARDDSNVSSRGANHYGGACEVFYVTGIQIGNKYYE